MIGIAMKAILLAGGLGTRLRPLTLHTPKPIVPIFNRPFLYYQIDLLRQIPEIDEVILSLNYQPQRIEEIVGDGAALGIKVRYLVEPKPLGTAGAVKYADKYLDGSVIVFNGDILTQIDLRAVLQLHRDRRARATIVLTPVASPSAYGLVETDAEGNVRQFLEKPDPEAITCNTINAGIYILEPATFDRIPAETTWSIERSYFPSLVDRRETFVAYIERGYWIDMGTPAQYRQLHHDIMDGRYTAPPFADQPGTGNNVSTQAQIEGDVEVEGPCFIDADCLVRTGARLRPYTVLGRGCRVDEGAVVDDSIVWADTQIGPRSSVRRSILGRGCRVGRGSVVGPDAVLGDESIVTEYDKADARG